MNLMDFNRTVPYVRKKGIAGYFQIIYHNFFDLVLLNFIFVLTSIPVFTIGASYKALITVCNKYACDEVVYPLREYFKSFKNRFLKSVLYGLSFAVTIVIISYSSIFYFNLAKENFVFYPFSFIGIVCLFLIIMLGCWFFPLFAETEYSFKQLIISSFASSLTYIKGSLAFLALNFLCFALLFLFFPYSVPFIAVLPFMLISLCSSCATAEKLKLNKNNKE